MSEALPRPRKNGHLWGAALPQEMKVIWQKPFGSTAPVTQKKIDMWNVTTCYACHTKLHARCFKAFKHDSFCNVSYRHGQIIRIANGCARLRTVAAGKPLPANPKHKREPFATQSGSFGKNHVFSATIWCTWGFIRKFFAGSTACGRGFGRSTASRFHPSANATVWNPGNECPSMVNVIQVLVSDGIASQYCWQFQWIYPYSINRSNMFKHMISTFIRSVFSSFWFPQETAWDNPMVFLRWYDRVPGLGPHLRP